MTKTEKVAQSILRPINPTLIIVLGIFTIIWGLWIMNPWSAAFGISAIYTAMASLLPEMAWGGIAVLAGSLTLRGAIIPSYDNLRTGSFVGFFHWFVIGILYCVSNFADPTGVMALTFAIYSALVWVNIKVNRLYYEALSK
jgi:hypothetical protein